MFFSLQEETAVQTAQLLAKIRSFEDNVTKLQATLGRNLQTLLCLGLSDDIQYARMDTKRIQNFNFLP